MFFSYCKGHARRTSHLSTTSNNSIISLSSVNGHHKQNVEESQVIIINEKKINNKSFNGNDNSIKCKLIYA
jgi:hypothetical protein